MPSPDTRPRDRTLALVALGALVIVGCVVRFLTRSPLWLDEALSVDIARLPLGDIPEALRHDGHPPLYYVLLHGWMAAFGEGDDGMAAFAPALARLAKGRAPRAEASFAAPTLERILAALSPLRATTRPFTHRQTAEEYRDWLKIPVLTDALLPDLSPDERARRIDAAFAGLRAEREETWIVVTAT